MEIIDQVIEPFKINVSDNSFDVYEKVQGQSKEGKPIEYEKNIGYFGSLYKAIQRIRHLQLARGTEIVDLTEYMEKARSLNTKLQNTIQRLERVGSDA